MSDGLERFNRLPKDDVSKALYATFADHRWVTEVAAGRPYADIDALLAATEAAFAELDAAGWLRAFKAHPRIGERGGESPAASENEQSRVRQGSAATLAALADENRRYEERFGFVFLIAAAGKSGDEILEQLRTRMANDRETELAQAAEEHRKITRMRLGRMLER